MIDARFDACIAVRRYGSISAAASHLYLSKQAVKKQIDSLENELGFAIFVRSNQGLKLTPTGEIYANEIEKICDQYNKLLGQCNSTEFPDFPKTLRILQPNHPRCYFTEELLEYNQRFPDVAINVINTKQHLVLYDSKARLQSLIDGVIDIVLAPLEDQGKHLDKSILTYQKLYDMPYYCLMKPTHPLSSHEYITRRDLKDNIICINTVIVDREVLSYIMDQEPCMKPKKVVHAENTVFNIPEVISFCLNGGVYISKGDYLNTLEPMVRIPFEPPFAVDFGIFYRTDCGSHVKAFVDMVKERTFRPHNIISRG